MKQLLRPGRFIVCACIALFTALASAAPPTTSPAARGAENAGSASRPDAATAERYYRILADNSTDPQQWVAAANWITTITDAPGAAPMRGESLRSKKNASVTDRLIKRAQSANSADLAMDLAAWDSASAARYYGFVGNHIIAMAPGDEIEVIDASGAQTRP